MACDCATTIEDLRKKEAALINLVKALLRDKNEWVTGMERAAKIAYVNRAYGTAAAIRKAAGLFPD